MPKRLRMEIRVSPWRKVTDMRDSDGEDAGARGGRSSSCSLRSTKGAVTTKTPVAKAMPLNFRAAAQSFVIKECRSVNREFFTDVDTSFRLIYKISSADQRKSNIFSQRSRETPIVDSQLRTIKAICARHSRREIRSMTAYGMASATVYTPGRTRYRNES